MLSETKKQVNLFVERFPLFQRAVRRDHDKQIQETTGPQAAGEAPRVCRASHQQLLLQYRECVHCAVCRVCLCVSHPVPLCMFCVTIPLSYCLLLTTS